MKRYRGDGGPTWVEDLGTDGITRRVRTHYSPEESGNFLLKQLGGYKEGSFRRLLEDILADCDHVLAEHDWIREENGKRQFPSDYDCQSDFDLWYAGHVGQLCWLALNYDHYLSGELGLQRAMTIGAQYTEWKCRHKLRPDVLARRSHIKENRKNAPKGGKVLAKRAELARTVLQQLALRPKTLRIWITLSESRQVSVLRKLARDYDRSRDDGEKLFGRKPGSLYEARWFSEELAKWRISGDLDRAMNSLAGK